MRTFNYAAYARTIELGIASPNMTKIAQALFEPIISHASVVNHRGNPYNIDPKQAKAWYEQTKGIPANIKTAAGLPDIVNSIGDYFSEHIIDELVNQMKEATMYSAMVSLIRDSDLDDESKRELLKCYEDGDRAEFLGRAFLYALVGDNLKKDPDAEVFQVDEDIRTFKELIKKSYKKPEKITPPDEIEDHEIGYVQELYKVYHEETGEEYVRPADLDTHLLTRYCCPYCYQSLIAMPASL